MISRLRRGSARRALLCLAAGLCAAAADPAPRVHTAHGDLLGMGVARAIAYLGIPYATPPVGARRWQAPGPAPSWPGLREATRFGAACIQSEPPAFGPYTAEFLAAPPFAEDCLTLNIWAPTSRATRLPVLVFIHGGGFTGGSGAVPIYDGAHLAAAGAVVVTINYRLGPFGFLSLPALDRGAQPGDSGTDGLQDIVAALRWVHADIADFGGDPARVTVAGQSAGAVAVDELLLSPPARGLFAHAIAESGSGMGVGAPTLAQARGNGAAFVQRLPDGHADAPGLRALAAAQVLAAMPSFVPTTGGPPHMPSIVFLPAIDGVVLTANPDDAAAPPSSAVPLLTGFNADESVRPNTQASPAQFTTAVRDRYGAFADRFLAAYPHATPAEAAASARLIARDRAMASLLIFAQQRSRTSGQKIYAYLFDHALPAAQGPSWGAFHTAEVPYVFGNLDAALRPYTTADHAVAARMSTTWRAFMASGQPGWQAVTPGDDRVMRLGDHPGLIAAVSTPARLALFRQYAASGGHLSLF